ncbi:hypothetical protein [Sphingomonas sp.]|nr:hypothetical protein [Sphingomonas sp.]
MLMVVAVLAVPTAIGVWLAEKRDRPRRRAMQATDRVQPAE